MRKTFDQQLDLLSQELTHMGALCETAIASATESLKKRDVELAKRAIAADQEIDQQEREIERLCLKLLLQQQPVARDLRQISSALKMITDMERIGDQAADISEIVTYMSQENLIQELDRIDAMAKAASQMVTQSVDAYVKKDLDLAKKVIADDDAVDELFEAILCLKDKEECYLFFEDVCTVNELLSLSQRFEVAHMLKEKRTYLEIAEKTGASTATISRVNRSLNYGNDGYEMVFSRLQDKREAGE